MNIPNTQKAPQSIDEVAAKAEHTPINETLLKLRESISTNKHAAGNIELYKGDHGVSLEIDITGDTIWLSQKQLCDLYGKDKSVISRHIKNIIQDEELSADATIAKNATVQIEGNREVVRDVEFYNLDMILSIGYRVNSKQATQFRQWATNVLKEHLVKGYTINKARLDETGFKELENALALIKTATDQKQLSHEESIGLVNVITDYAKSWLLLQQYDENQLPEIAGTTNQLVPLTYPEAKKVIHALKESLMAKGEATQLFGNEKANELEGIIGNIYQTFGGIDLIPSTESKAAHLMFYIIKDHPFSDGNKRIGSMLFIKFLQDNDLLYRPDGSSKVNENALVALALLVAQSDPKQKNTTVRLIENILIDYKSR